MSLPPGFRMATRSAQSLPGSSEPVAHLVFTDGIASVSVFVEPRKPDTQPAEGPARVGSSSAFSTVVDGHQVTAVGEVPPNTVGVHRQAGEGLQGRRRLRVRPQVRLRATAQVIP